MSATGTGGTKEASGALLPDTVDESAMLLELVETDVGVARALNDAGVGIGTLVGSEDAVAIKTAVVVVAVPVAAVVVIVFGDVGNASKEIDVAGGDAVEAGVGTGCLSVKNGDVDVATAGGDVVIAVADEVTVVPAPKLLSSVHAIGSPLTAPTHVLKSASPTRNGFSEPALAWMSKRENGMLTPKSLYATVVTRAATVANLVCISSTTIDRPTEASGAPNPVELIATALPNMAP